MGQDGWSWSISLLGVESYFSLLGERLGCVFFFVGRGMLEWVISLLEERRLLRSISLLKRKVKVGFFFCWRGRNEWVFSLLREESYSGSILLLEEEG